MKKAIKPIIYVCIILVISLIRTFSVPGKYRFMTQEWKETDTGILAN